jgi:uncharacterized peroxidase-related enzyme
MSTVSLIEYENASAEVRAIFDDIKKVRQVADVNNFWKALANHPAALERTWESLKQVMAAGTLTELEKEMIYLAVSITNNCEYCIHSHTASAINKGMSPAQYAELVAVVAMAHETNAFANAMKIPVDAGFLAR